WNVQALGASDAFSRVKCNNARKLAKSLGPSGAVLVASGRRRPCSQWLLVDDNAHFSVSTTLRIHDASPRSKHERAASVGAPVEQFPVAEMSGTNPQGATHPLTAVTRYAQLSGWIFTHLSRETTSGRFIPEMDGLRFVAIGMVILFHLSGYLTAKSILHYSAPPQSDWLAQIARVGFRGVELFFVI